MGVTLATAEFLVDAHQRGASFERTATIGRQALFAGPRRLERMLRRRGAWNGSGGELRRRLATAPGTLEPLLEVLGAVEITAIDASEYEGADLLHDLNEPVPEALHGRFTTVFDGGTMEHVFDVPAVLRNYLAMVEVGGRLILHTMANNYLGHGFYQFSPELFFRVLTPENGYVVERVLLVENDILWRGAPGLRVPVERSGRWFEVTDPEAVRSRVELKNRRPVVIQVVARRTADVPLLARPPQQSDYVAQWTGESVASPPAAAAARRRLAGVLPPRIRAWLGFDVMPRVFAALGPLYWPREAVARSFRNRRVYRRVR